MGHRLLRHVALLDLRSGYRRGHRLHRDGLHCQPGGHGARRRSAFRPHRTGIQYHCQLCASQWRHNQLYLRHLERDHRRPQHRVDRSDRGTTAGAVYTGLALGSVGSNNYLYAANTAGSGSIQVFDTNYNNVTGSTFAGTFNNPFVPAGYVPFNIQLIGSQLYVTYAELGAGGVAAPGSTGEVAVFNTNGTFVSLLASGGPLDAPWGIALAPAGFGSFSNDLLIGNFGSGEIDAYSTSGVFEGILDDNGVPIVDPNLWALDFRTGGASSTNPDALYFTAGVDNQSGGLFGEIVETPEPPPFVLVGLGVLALILARFRAQPARRGSA